MTCDLLTPAQADADPAIRALYESAFPEDERIPWSDLLRLVREMPLELAVYRGPAAMTILIKGEDTFTEADYDRLLSEIFRFWKPERKKG